MSKLEDALWDSDTAFKRLKPEQGRVARRNAREAMLKALRLDNDEEVDKVLAAIYEAAIGSKKLGS